MKSLNNFLKIILIFILFIIFFYFYSFRISLKAPIKVGILHSRTGTLSISEEPVIKATLLAIKEVNENGGVLGRKLEPIIADGQSNPPTFAKEADRLINKEKVPVIFGCWTSTSRKEVKPIVEKHNSLLFYPIQYEGIENSPNIIYTGAAPNQQLIPGLVWAVNNFGKKIFLIGSDYIFPRVANKLIKKVGLSLDVDIIGEEYIELGSTNIEATVNKIKELKPDVVLNTLNGDTNIAFFNLEKLNVPILSFSISEIELPFLMLNASNTYACWNYFQSLNTETNKKFLIAMNKEYGIDQLINDPMEAAYFGVKIWAKAANKARSISTNAVKKELYNITFLAPEGFIQIDPSNNHTWKSISIGKANPDGQFNIIWNSMIPIKPEPYPNNLLIQKTVSKKNYWNKFINNLHKERVN